MKKANFSYLAVWAGIPAVVTGNSCVYCIYGQ